MTQIGSVYAGALYSLAKDEGLTETIRAEMAAFDEAFAGEPDFVRLLSAHGLSTEERLKILDDSFSGKVHVYLLNFMKILTKKGYMRHFSECCKAFKEIYNDDHGILAVQAVTAIPMTDAQKEKLCAKLGRTTGKKIELFDKVDPSCLGGVRLDYDGKCVDDTIVNRLDAIASLLKNTIL